MSKQSKAITENPRPTLFPTVTDTFTVWAKKQVGSMKPEQVGTFRFERMRFSPMIMIYGDFGDFKEEGNGGGKIVNVLGFYKSLSYQDCLEAFNFGTSLDRFEQTFFLTETYIQP